ncbi:MAG: pilus assembly protein N-terminal domain-containing protein [Holosporaceae bacterium]|jgi:pilus assembly protein CpaC|nr:pilus assembly protein N-terminal domain-containing protein [Holosporaceae bacterium]
MKKYVVFLVGFAFLANFIYCESVCAAKTSAIEDDELEDEDDDEEAEEKKVEKKDVKKARPKPKQLGKPAANSSSPKTESSTTQVKKIETNSTPDKTISSNGAEVKEIEVNSVNFIKLSEKANEIFIPNPTVADIDMLSDSSLYLTGLAPGVTFLVAHNKRGKIIADYQIRVTYPLREIKKALAGMYPETDVEIVSVDNSVVLKGKVPSPEAAADIQDIVGRFVESSKIINKLSIETATQVMLKVKIAEVSRSLTKSLAINWRALSPGDSASGMHYGFMTGNPGAFPTFTKDAAPIDIAKDINEKTFASTVSGGRWLAHTGGHNGLSALIDAIATESFASVLAEPTLIALSGKTATFNVGGEVSYTVKQSGTDSNTTEFKQWGTSIEFTPIVLSEDRINITIKPSVSTIGEKNNEGVPSLNTKDASTTVELGSGQSMAIAGLLQTTKDTASSETPLLADIPLIGSLFRDSKVGSKETELVIIVTPYIVKPSSRQLKTPVEMVPKMYSPLESILTRKFHKNVKQGQSAGFSIM